MALEGVSRPTNIGTDNETSKETDVSYMMSVSMDSNYNDDIEECFMEHHPPCSSIAGLCKERMLMHELIPEELLAPSIILQSGQSGILNARATCKHWHELMKQNVSSQQFANHSLLCIHFSICSGQGVDS